MEFIRDLISKRACAREQGERQRERESLADSLLSTEPDLALDLKTPRP